MLGPLMNSPEQTVKAEVLPKQGAASGFVLIISKTDAQFNEVRARVTVSAIAQRKKWEGIRAREKNNSARSILFSQEVLLTDRDLELDLGSLRAYDFTGSVMKMTHEVLVELVDSGESLTLPVALPIPGKDRFGMARALIYPYDDMDLLRNFQALSSKAKLKIGMIQLGLLSASVFLFVVGAGMMDSSKDGPGSPEVVFFWMALWITPLVFMVRQFWGSLKNYASVKRKNPFHVIRKGGTYELRSLLKGQVDLDLSGATIKIVCCNMERYKYLEYRHNAPDRWVRGYEPFNGHTVYEAKIKDMPAGADIDKYLPHDLVDFSIMFEKLYPQLMIGSYGITVYWEIQIIHPELRDLEIPVFGRGKDYVYEDFIGLEPDTEAA